MFNTPFSPSWKKDVTFTTDGGKYMFKYDAKANKFYAVCIKKYVSVETTGSIDLKFNESTEKKDVFVAYTDLKKGAHTFKVSVNGKEYGCGTTFYGSMYEILYNSDWKKETTFNSETGKYMFMFNAETKKLSVFLLEKYVNVELVGDIELDLKKSTLNQNNYTATKNLEAGTYTFKISVEDVEYGFGATFNESIYKIKYASDWKSATTFKVKGGNYRFAFDVTTNTLSVYAVK